MLAHADLHADPRPRGPVLGLDGRTRSLGLHRVVLGLDGEGAVLRKILCCGSDRSVIRVVEDVLPGCGHRARARPDKDSKSSRGGWSPRTALPSALLCRLQPHTRGTRTQSCEPCPGGGWGSRCTDCTLNVMDLTPYWESDGERRREQQLQLGGPPVGERCICTYVAAPAAVHVPIVVFSFVPRQSRHGGCVWRRHGRGQHRARESRGGEGAAQRKALPPWQPEGPRSPPLRMGGGDPKVFRLTVFESRGVSSTELAESFPTVCLAPPNSQRRSVPSVQWGLLPTPTLARASQNKENLAACRVGTLGRSARW